MIIDFINLTHVIFQAFEYVRLIVRLILNVQVQVNNYGDQFCNLIFFNY